jgi:hypothetical protein
MRIHYLVVKKSESFFDHLAGVTPVSRNKVHKVHACGKESKTDCGIPLCYLAAEDELTRKRENFYK